MRRETLIYIGLILAIACLIFVDNNRLLGGMEVEKVFDLNQYDLTQIDLDCEVYVTEGENGKLVLQADEATAEKLVTSDENGILSIKQPNKNLLLKWFDFSGLAHQKVKIYINHDQLDKIRISDRATIISMDYSRNKIPSYNRADNFNGSGKLFKAFDVQSLSLPRISISNFIPAIL